MTKIKATSVALLAIIACGTLTYCVGEPATWYWRKRSSSMRALATAKNKEELEKAGIYLPVASGSWIVIDYNDTHNGRIQSLAVAFTSDGRWYESDRHFCGAFSGYLHMRATREALRRLCKLT